MEQKFNVTGETKIGWGKLKGQNHSVFLNKENEKYMEWVINQGPDFRYTNTREWLLKQQDNSTPQKITLTPHFSMNDQEWYDFHTDLSKLCENYPNVVMYF